MTESVSKLEYTRSIARLGGFSVCCGATDVLDHLIRAGMFGQALQ
jgi:hypothetical protein